MGKKVDINLTPQHIVGKEFYLAVDDGPIESPGLLGRLYHSVKSRFFGEEPVQTPTLEGDLIEIAQRNPGFISGYMWPAANTVRYEDGQKVLQLGYLFVPQSMAIEGEHFSMTGHAFLFNPSTNSKGDPLEQLVTVGYEGIPETKEADFGVGFR